MRASKKSSTPLASIGMMLSLLWLLCPLLACSEELVFEERIRPDYSPRLANFLHFQEGWNYQLYLASSAVFPTMDIGCSLSIENTGKDTLRLAGAGSSFVKYLRFEHLAPQKSELENAIKMMHPPGTNESLAPLIYYLRLKYVLTDTSTPPQDIKVAYLDKAGNAVSNGEINPWKNVNALEPGQKILIKANCRWKDLNQIQPGIRRFRWRFDNLSAAAQDSSIFPIKYAGPGYDIEVKSIPEDRLDTLYYLNLQADKLNGAGRFDHSLEYCYKILQMDSTNLYALRTASDVLWKTSRFDEAIPLIERALASIKKGLDQLGVNEDYMDAAYFLGIFHDRIDKCQKRVKWSGAK